MAIYELQTLIATGYDRVTGWQYANGPTETIPYEDPLQCDKAYDEKVLDLVVLASINKAAAKVMIVRKEGEAMEVTRSKEYDGEKVYFWYAANNKKGETIFEDRLYISRVYVDIGYYALVHPDNRIDNTEVVAACQSMYDLQEELGEEFQLYENRT